LTTIRVPASTSNLGAGFDSLGLALGLYLTISIESSSEPFGSFTFEGEGADDLKSSAEENLIFQAMRFAASREEVELTPARLMVNNQIPIARGLGSSGAAIIAGISAFEVITGRRLPEDRILRYATELEGHSDNVSAALLGSFVVSCTSIDGSVGTASLQWPDDVMAVVVIPEFLLRTEKARAVLPETVPRADAIFNVQRSALMVAAVAGRRFDLFQEAMRDALHQPYRVSLVPGMREVLELGSGELRRIPGFLGLAISGSGPTVIALARENCDRIASCIKERFERADINCRSHILGIDGRGRVIQEDDEVENGEKQ
jgi:homoserine kinase